MDLFSILTGEMNTEVYILNCMLKMGAVDCI